MAHHIYSSAYPSPHLSPSPLHLDVVPAFQISGAMLAPVYPHAISLLCLYSAFLFQYFHGFRHFSSLGNSIFYFSSTLPSLLHYFSRVLKLLNFFLPFTSHTISHSDAPSRFTAITTFFHMHCHHLSFTYIHENQHTPSTHFQCVPAALHPVQ